MTATIFPVDAVSGAPSYTGRQLRQSFASLLESASAARPFGCASGVRRGTPTSTVTATSTTWTVQPHGGVVDAEASGVAGPYEYAFDAVVTGNMTAADASNPRIDLLSVQMSDPAESDGSATPSAAVVYTAGVAGATPAVPAAPARSLVLAQISVPKAGGGSPSVTWVASFLTAAGGILTVAGSAQYPASPYAGQIVDDATFGLMRWNGTAWLPPGDSGEQPIVPMTGYTAVNTPVARRVGKLVILSGAIKQTSGSYVGSTVNIATLPAGFAPAGTRGKRYTTPGSAGSSAGAIEILLAGGSLTIQAAGIGSAPDTAYLDGVSYFIT